MTKKLEKLADEMIRLTPEEGQQLSLIIKAKIMPEMAKQQQQQGLLQQQNLKLNSKWLIWVTDQKVKYLCLMHKWLHNKDY
jgi:hypothetical protein